MSTLQQSIAQRGVHHSLHDEVAARLRSMIFEGELVPGSFIDEGVLCEVLQISRTPLREALKVLNAEGLVRHEPRRGCFVNQVTEQDLDEIFPVIALLEGRCAFEAARNATDADLAALDLLHERLNRHVHRPGNRTGITSSCMRWIASWRSNRGPQKLRWSRRCRGMYWPKRP